VHHSSSSTTFAIPWSAVASPVGRYGETAKTFNSVCLAAIAASRSADVAPPLAAAVRQLASADAEAPAAARSRSPGDRGESSRTAAALAAEASHQPARRAGISATVPEEATGST
jgi:hypothetical protein